MAEGFHVVGRAAVQWATSRDRERRRLPRELLNPVPLASSATEWGGGIRNQEQTAHGVIEDVFVTTTDDDGATFPLDGGSTDGRRSRLVTTTP